MDFDILGVVTGTARTYGSTANDCAWCERVTRGRWTGIDSLPLPIRVPVRVDFRFRLFPDSPAYFGQCGPNGCDLDTMVLQDSTLGGITVHGGQRPSLKIIESPRLCSLVTAEKELVTSDDRAGVEIRLRPFDESDASAFPAPDLRVKVPRSSFRFMKELPLAVERAAEETNRAKGLSFRSKDRIGLAVRFATATGKSNVLTLSYLEAVVDALGNSSVGSRRLFESNRFNGVRRIRNTDDSIVFALYCEQRKTCGDEPFVELGVYSAAEALKSWPLFQGIAHR